MRSDGQIEAQKVYAGQLYFWTSGKYLQVTTMSDLADINTGAGQRLLKGDPSDVRLKTDLRPIPRALDKVLQLQGILFRWSQAGLDYFTHDIENQVLAGPDATPEENQRVWDEERARSHEDRSGDNVGLIAQEVEAVLPELVNEDKQGYKHIRYDQITALLVEAIKEQNIMIKKLSEKLAALGAV
jgi:hypothetical protein